MIFIRREVDDKLWTIFVSKLNRFWIYILNNVAHECSTFEELFITDKLCFIRSNLEINWTEYK